MACWISCEWYTWMSCITVIFFCYGGNECIRKQPTYMRSPSYFAALFQFLYFYYSKTRAVDFLQLTFWPREAIELLNWSLIIALKTSRAPLFHTVLSKKKRMEWFVWVTPGLNFCDVISARRYFCFLFSTSKDSHDVFNLFTLDLFVSKSAKHQ